MCSFVCRTPFHNCPPSVTCPSISIKISTVRNLKILTAFEFDLTVITHAGWAYNSCSFLPQSRPRSPARNGVEESLEGGVRTGQMDKCE